MDDKYKLAVVSVICLTCIELMALYMKMDGQVLSIVIGAICTIFGACIGVKLATTKKTEMTETAS